MFLRRSLASLARAYKLHVYDFFLCRYIWGLAPPPPPPYQKASYATVASFRSPEEWPNEDGRFRSPPPPHSLHEIAATAQDLFEVFQRSLIKNYLTIVSDMSLDSTRRKYYTTLTQL